MSIGRAMPVGDKQQPSSVKKVALRELPNETANIINKPLRTSPLPRDKGPSTDATKVLGAKRQQDGPSSPGYQNVYVRRKVENEHHKISPSQESKKIGRDEIKEQNVHQDKADKPKVASPVAESEEAAYSDLRDHQVSSESLAKPTTETTGPVVPEPNESPVASRTPCQDDHQRSSNEYWKERFVRLQAYLENCDRASQEDYIRMLRSLPAVGRSKHAIELEKRAIHLFLEEAKETQRVKVLNVLGRTSNDPLSVSTQTPLQQWCQK